jgi:hypothetical protein
VVASRFPRSFLGCPHDLEAPELGLGMGEMEALERDSHLHRIALIIDVGICEEEGIKVSVEPEKSSPSASSPFLGVDAVSLNAA